MTFQVTNNRFSFDKFHGICLMDTGRENKMKAGLNLKWAWGKMGYGTKEKAFIPILEYISVYKSLD